MFEVFDDGAQITFQWVVGDFKELGKKLSELASPKHHYAILIVSRLVAYAVTFTVAYGLLRDANFHHILWIAAAGTLSIWVALGIELVAHRGLDRLMADDPRRVGWNSIWIDRSGVTFATETTEDYASWLGVSGIDDLDGAIWIRTGQAHGVYIPSRVFTSRIQLMQCRDLIDKFRASPLPPRHLADPEREIVKH